MLLRRTTVRREDFHTWLHRQHEPLPGNRMGCKRVDHPGSQRSTNNNHFGKLVLPVVLLLDYLMPDRRAGRQRELCSLRDRQTGGLPRLWPA